MERLLDFLEKHRWGILATFLLHAAGLLYLQIDTYSYKLPERPLEIMAETIEDEFIELAPEQIIPNEPIAQQNNQGIVKNITQNTNDKRQKSYDDFSRSSTDKKIEQNVKELERQYFEELSSSRGKSGSGAGIAKAGSEGSAASATNENNTKQKERDNSSSSSSNSENQYQGKTMVRFDLGSRIPHNNNDWHIRNPGYTCGNNSNGTVVVAIKVNTNGDVVGTRYVPEMSSDANSCMIEQAQIYAKKSRFAFDNSAPKSQDGYIYYTFISK